CIRDRSGAVGMLPPFPAVLHGDISGTIVACGPGIRRFREGDQVFGMVGWTGGEGGALAEFARCDERLLALAPRSIPLVEAAALPVAALAAWQALARKIVIRKGMSLLVVGGAGGVGHFGVQIGKALGAQVAATVSSEEKAAVALRAGADQIIRYDLEQTEDYVLRLTGGRGFDAVFDTAGGQNLPRSFVAAKPGGAVVTIAARATVDLSLMHAKGLDLHVVFVLLPILRGEGREIIGEDLVRITEMVDTARVRAIIYPRIFSLESAGEAHRLLESGAHYGKLLVVVS
ncbi:MAG: zinc-binding dehydrogenase, partial [Rectinema sp.]|nr:zinc-binding dehydrogenase [Rectinema sp.]